MRGMVRAVSRLALMGFVMVAVLVTATAIGLPTAAVLGLSITIAGLAGLTGISRRAAAPGAAIETQAERALDGVAPADGRAGWAVASMEPGEMVDPEAHLPRWRRPSLIAARKADPLRVSNTERAPMRFSPGPDSSPARRIVRYAVVALLDRPDEVMGRQISDLLAGDEVEVLDSAGSFWQILCPDGLRGWVHRTTLGLPGVEHLTFGRRVEAVAEPDDILTAVLSARGIQ
jgi:hypothetical protein